jgi:hypothetical protein
VAGDVVVAVEGGRAGIVLVVVMHVTGFLVEEGKEEVVARVVVVVVEAGVVEVVAVVVVAVVVVAGVEGVVVAVVGNRQDPLTRGDESGMEIHVCVCV